MPVCRGSLFDILGVFSFCYYENQLWVFPIFSNAEYNGPFWRILRGQDEPSSIREHLRSSGCCSESGVTAKIIAYFRVLDKSNL